MKSLLILALLLFSLPLSLSAQIREPGKDEWIEVSEEPKPLLDIQRLVEYPENAKHAGVEGTVVVSALIGEDGRVIKVDVEKSDHEWLTEAAVQAMMQVRFSPAKQGEKAIKVWYTQAIKFKLRDRWLGSDPEEDPRELEWKISKERSEKAWTESLPITKAKVVGEMPTLPMTDELGGLDSIALELRIGTYGHVLDIKTVDRSLQSKLTEPVLRILRDLKFTPTKVGDRAIVSTEAVTIAIGKAKKKKR